MLSQSSVYKSKLKTKLKVGIENFQNLLFPADDLLIIMEREFEGNSNLHKIPVDTRNTKVRCMYLYL